MSSPVPVFIGLGSNLGDRARHLAEAIAALTEHGTYVRGSALYETAPVGGPEQGPYLNAVVLLETSLGPRRLLDVCLAIERDHGRERRERWGPRTLDLDILLYDDRVVDEAGLTVPHPHLTERRFVLEPLLEVDPHATLPDGTSLAGFLPAVADQVVRRLGAPVPGRAASALVFLGTGLAAVALWWLLGRVL